MAMPLILLADEVAVLCAEEKLLILLPSWSLGGFALILCCRRSNNIVLAPKSLISTIYKPSALAVWGTCSNAGVWCGLTDWEGFPSGFAMLRRELLPPWGL